MTIDSSNPVTLDFERCYRAVVSRDPRFDGWFFTAVTSTGIYCRPSCPAVPASRPNVCFFPSAAAAQRRGFRACKRCRPDAAPGSPEWNGRADLVSRAMRLIADGVVDRDGVPGLAARLGYTPRHLRRLLTAEVGAGPLGLARAQRAQTARTLIETTDLPFSRVAFAAGFSSIRQFNDTVQTVYATTPARMREQRSRRTKPRSGEAADSASGSRIALRLAYREPCDLAPSIAFLAARTVRGVDEVRDGTYRTSLTLPHGHAIVELTPAEGYVWCVLVMADLRDLQTAVRRCRCLLDLDADPVAVEERLGRDPLLGPAVRRLPGLRLVGSPDPSATAVAVVVGQQIAVASARTVLGRLADACGLRLTLDDDSLTRAFPTVGDLAEADPGTWPLPAARRHALHQLCSRLAGGEIHIDGGSDPERLRADLTGIRGIGPWTVDLVRMRALGDPDVFLPTDLGVRRGLAQLRAGTAPAAAAVRNGAAVYAASADWRPWRSYAVQHLWTIANRAHAARRVPVPMEAQPRLEKP